MAFGIAASLLIGVVRYLPDITYRSQQHLQNTAMARLQENLAGLVQAVDNFILERRNDMRNPASSSMTEAYFTNKAPGMSMEYGLKGSLSNIINTGIKDTLVITRNEYKYVADVTTDLGDLPEIHRLPEKLNQVFLNLIINSAHATHPLQRAITADCPESGGTAFPYRFPEISDIRRG